MSSTPAPRQYYLSLEKFRARLVDLLEDQKFTELLAMIQQNQQAVFQSFAGLSTTFFHQLAYADTTLFPEGFSVEKVWSTIFRCVQDGLNGATEKDVFNFFDDTSTQEAFQQYLEFAPIGSQRPFASFFELLKTAQTRFEKSVHWEDVWQSFSGSFFNSQLADIPLSRTRQLIAAFQAESLPINLQYRECVVLKYALARGRLDYARFLIEECRVLETPSQATLENLQSVLESGDDHVFHYLVVESWKHSAVPVVQTDRQLAHVVRTRLRRSDAALSEAVEACLNHRVVAELLSSSEPQAHQKQVFRQSIRQLLVRRSTIMKLLPSLQTAEADASAVCQAQYQQKIAAANTELSSLLEKLTEAVHSAAQTSQFIESSAVYQAMYTADVMYQHRRALVRSLLEREFAKQLHTIQQETLALHNKFALHPVVQQAVSSGLISSEEELQRLLSAADTAPRRAL